jgi:hypothetical protein
LSKNLLVCASLLAASVVLAGCNQTPETANANVNTNLAVPTTTTRPGPDNSDITTTTDANGVTTETRVFRDNPRVARVVVTKHSGTRTTRVYSRTGEEKELKEGESESVLDKTGDAIADAAGFVADKTVAGTKKGIEVGKDVAGKTAETAKTVGDKTVDVSKKVGNKTADVAKTVGSKTAEGAKKTGKAIKKVVTP